MGGCEAGALPAMTEVRLRLLPPVPIRAIRVWTGDDQRWGAPFQACGLAIGAPPECEIGLWHGVMSLAIKRTLSKALAAQGFETVFDDRYHLLNGEWECVRHFWRGRA